jgi:hypothetical protein
MSLRNPLGPRSFRPGEGVAPLELHMAMLKKQNESKEASCRSVRGRDASIMASSRNPGVASSSMTKSTAGAQTARTHQAQRRRPMAPATNPVHDFIRFTEVAVCPVCKEDVAHKGEESAVPKTAYHLNKCAQTTPESPNCQRAAKLSPWFPVCTRGSYDGSSCTVHLVR